MGFKKDWHDDWHKEDKHKDKHKKRRREHDGEREREQKKVVHNKIVKKSKNVAVAVKQSASAWVKKGNAAAFNQSNISFGGKKDGHGGKSGSKHGGKKKHY
ncbi:hypothetical protein [Paenibacillus sp. 481]|uniref:hypothetical protein n=1 Tax=Paenibacillus sp. 481 TaxID=2835869 RepID=UPI001E326E47|nr:hypothetical protein [Paenibacillus sp. 481]UHA73588.1 hypothetical protein KIK04_24115 [Paenibacillus sp. 481]